MAQPYPSLGLRTGKSPVVETRLPLSPPIKVLDPFSDFLIDPAHLPPASREDQPGPDLHPPLPFPSALLNFEGSPSDTALLRSSRLPGALRAASGPAAAAKHKALLRGRGTKVARLALWQRPSKRCSSSKDCVSSSTFRNLQHLPHFLKSDRATSPQYRHPNPQASPSLSPSLIRSFLLPGGFSRPRAIIHPFAHPSLAEVLSLPPRPCEISYRTQHTRGRVAPPRRAATPRPVAICRDRGREERLPSTSRQQPKPCGFRSSESRLPSSSSGPQSPRPIGAGRAAAFLRLGKGGPLFLKAINTIWGIFNCSIKHAVNNYSLLR